MFARFGHGLMLCLSSSCVQLLQLTPGAGRGGGADFVKRKRPNFRHGNAVRCEAMPARKVKIYP